MVKIWLDDIRPAPHGWLRTYTVDETKQALLKWRGQVAQLSLDNDLGPKLPEGRTVVLWLAEKAADGFDCWPDKITVHSANPVAKEYMLGMLARYGPYTEHNGAFIRAKTTQILFVSHQEPEVSEFRALCNFNRECLLFWDDHSPNGCLIPISQEEK